ncbi:MAG: hypothetical protein RBT49_13080 [Bacteroidales bacterium]|jgi:hypothetical protein|nr:hypothetical protein [Bacteroidales bacterium]
MKTEIVFEIGGEGGGICIKREKSQSEERFIYHQNEFDPTDEGLDVKIKDEYINFEVPFQLINNKYPWHALYAETVHKDFREYIIEKLIEKLNNSWIEQKHFHSAKERWEKILKGELNCKMNSQNVPYWSFVATNKKPLK